MVKTAAILSLASNSWYPSPNSPEDQKEAVAGTYQSVEDIISFTEEFVKSCKQLYIGGFSAGAVMAIQVALKLAPKAVFVHSGAILDPRTLPECKILTKFHIFHGNQDNVFLLKERGIPMINALALKNYNISAHVSNFAHYIKDKDIQRICNEENL